MESNKNTFCVIMAGGIGSRFWPMSTPDLPKQFHDVLGLGKTLIRMTFERILPVCPAENVLIVTNERYHSLVKEQLPEVDDSQILGEPMMRNTAPCLAYANFWIANKSKDANIIVLSADQLITNEAQFLADVKKGIDVAEKTDSLVTMGIKPSNPNTGYGYIQFNEEGNSYGKRIRKVKTFTEKPDLETAQKFLESGEFYWNSGMFIWTLNTIQAAFTDHLKDVYDLFAEKPTVYGTAEEATFIKEIYPKCENISIDYGIMERAKNVLVILSDFGWSDLGTWGSVYNHLPKDKNENALRQENIVFFESSENIVKLPLNKKAVIQGLEGYIVVESNGVLLICKKDKEQRIKEYSKSLS